MSGKQRTQHGRPRERQATMKLVLAGDDGSDGAARAVAWAKSLAAEHSAAVIALHVGSAHSHDAVDDGVTRITVPDRYPAAAVMEVAAERGADLIVLGRRGAGGFPSLPIGTTAHVVAASSGRPVVIVPPTHRRQTPLVGRVVVGVDRLPGSRAALMWSARVFPEAQFELVHAIDLGPTFAHLDIDDPKAYERAHQAVVS
jgi:nucleotide-binding universal stress UspA family protein